MEIAFQVVCVLLIIGAVLLFLKRTSANTMITKAQKALAVCQIILCGGFFALCLSDVLDVRVSFSPVRLFLNIFYALAFLSLTAFALSGLKQKKESQVRIIVCFCAALIAAQCFVFPYDAKNEFIRVCEACEGIAVFTMLILLAVRLRNGNYGQNALLVIVLLELAVAVLNTVLPMASITEDIQPVDVPMNYLALYMRPVIFSSLALVYRVWLDLRRAEGRGENGQAVSGLSGQD